MARGRLLPRDFVRDRRVARLSLEAFAYYQAALAFLDRDGLLTGDADLLLSDLAPLRRTDIDLKMRAIIQEWTTQGLFVAYGDVDDPVLFCPDFRKHNRDMEYTKEGASTFPPPPGYFRSKHGLIPNEPELAQRLAEDFSDANNYGKTLAYYAEHGCLPPEDEKRKSTAKQPVSDPSEPSARADRDPVESKSRVTRPEDQTEDQHVVVGVQTDTDSLPGYGKGGVVGGDQPQAAKAPKSAKAGRRTDPLPSPTYDADRTLALDESSRPFLMEVALELGAEQALDHDFSGWRTWLEGLDSYHLFETVAWLWKWRSMSLEDLEAINSMPAVLRSNVEKGNPAALRPGQLRELLIHAGVIEGSQEDIAADL